MASDAEMVEACPNCDTTTFTERRHNGRGRPPDSDHRFRCERCGERFDEPVERPRSSPSGELRSAHVRALLETDPEDVPGGGSA